MKKTKSALFALILAVALCLLAGCVVDDGGNNKNGPSEGLAYTSNGDGNCYVSGIGSCTDKKIMIPATSPEGETVVGIGEAAFKDCKAITSVLIPDGVTDIAKDAFNMCLSLEEVNIPEGVVNIGEYAFAECLSVREIRLPSTVQTIGENAFIDCVRLESVNLSEGITEIPYGCFLGCSNLTSITIPSTVTKLGQGAFMSCSSLVEICNRSKLDIEDKYYSTSYVTSYAIDVIADESESRIKRAGDFVFYDNDGELLLVRYLGREREITLPAYEGSTNYKIHNFAFHDNNYIARVTIPEGASAIGRYAFDSCISLVSVTIPSSVGEIASDAFFLCYSLIEVCNKSSVAPNTDAHIITDESASCIKTIGDYLFYDDGSEIYLAKYLGRESEIRLPEYNGGEEYKIYKWAFVNPNFNHRLRSMTYVEIPDFVTEIGEYAFSECNSLERVVIGDGVKSIKNAFAGCQSIKSITLGKSVSDADISFLTESRSITDITVDEENKTYKSIDGNLYSKDGRTMIAYASGKTDTTFIVPVGVTVIGKMAFRNSANLTEVVISDGVKEIRDKAFSNCVYFTMVVIPTSLEKLGKDVFNSLRIEDSNGTMVSNAYYTGTEEEWKALRKANNDSGLPYLANYNFVYGE